MGFKILETVLQPMRQHHRISDESKKIYMGVEEQSDSMGLCVVSTAKGDFKIVNPTSEGLRYGVFESPLRSDDEVFCRLYDFLKSEVPDIVFKDKQAALDARKNTTTIVISDIVLAEQSAENYDLLTTLMSLRGFIFASEQGVVRSCTGLPKSGMVFFPKPEFSGVYFRKGDHLGICLYDVRKLAVV